MSYYVEYNPELRKHYPPKRKKQNKPTVSIVILLTVAVAAYISVQSGLVRYLIPGNPEITTVAFSQLIEQVVSGKPIRQSVITFCEEIIANGA